jgi:hypothetical protein
VSDVLLILASCRWDIDGDCPLSYVSRLNVIITQGEALRNRPSSRRCHRLGTLLLAGPVVTALLLTTSSAGAHAALADPNLSVNAHATDDIGRALLSSTYAGTTYNSDLGTIDVYLTQLDKSLENQLVGNAPPSEYLFHVVPHSEQQMDALTDAITRDTDSLAAQGVRVEQWGPDPATGTVQIGAADPVAAAPVLAARYGAQNITVVQGTEMAPMTNRLYDASPWNGGDFISDGVALDCTSGPPVHTLSSGVRYLFTAGHCWSVNGPTIRNESYTLGIFESNSIGIVNARPSNWNTGGLDIELIHTSSSRLDWRGYSTSEAQYTYFYRSLAGDSVCASGAYEGEHCGNVVQSGKADYCVTFSNGQKSCHLSYAANPSSSAQVAGNADSGGPVYSVDYSQGLTVRGIINGGPTSTKCTSNNPDGSRLCSNAFVFTNIGYALDAYGLGINT